MAPGRPSVLRALGCARWVAFLAAIAGAHAAASPAVAPAPSSEPQHFAIEEFRVEGNTLLPNEEIEAAVYGFLGPNRTAADAEQARAALEDLYRKKGYPTVTAELPRQSIDSGVIVLTVTERKIGRLRVTGAHYFEPDVVRRHAPSLAPGTVPNMRQVRRDILALNHQPDRSVTPVLKAGKAPDTVDVDLEVADKLPLHGSLELDNRQSADTTALRTTGSLRYDNLWQRGDSASFFFQVAPQHMPDAQVFSGSYLFHIPDTDLALLGSYLSSDSNVTSIGGTNVVGKGQIYGLRLIIPLTQDNGFTQALSVGMDYKDFSQALTLSGQGSHVPLQYYPVAASYQADWVGKRSQTDLTAGVVAGTRGLGGSDAAFDNNRFDAKANFFYLRGAISHTDELPWGMQAWARLQGQASAEPLVPNEQLSAGGQDTVRGYLESEVLGDSGAILQMELRGPSLAKRIGPLVNDFRLHAFVDLAHTSINQPLPEQVQKYSLGSVGVGLRVRLLDHLSGTIEDAFVLSNGPTTKAGSDRVLFRVLGEF
ncbi:MAG TPA: ShlB/FhaC/HecB family hemolysin secretion/activation protein [Acetobacteraceae bacterium]|nr:ShlB/FhaC/HecB family hemolysin secretion/activation protein [Acetobacteraceae bacterium]